jgi:aspartyl-tRNA(Asn)/glutamyl-tRNA(Gln) amidotransferase subunit C
MTLSLDEVRHIAHLARLDLTPEELERYREQLSAVLDHIVKLSLVDTSGIEPASSITPARSVLRADESRPGLPREKLLENAPETEGGHFRVPPVLE